MLPGAYPLQLLPGSIPSLTRKSPGPLAYLGRVNI